MPAVARPRGPGRSWIGWTWLLLLLALSASPLATADDDRFDDEAGGEGEDDAGEALGSAALWVLGATTVTAGANLARRRWVMPGLRGRPGAIKRVMWTWRKVLLPVHALTGVTAVLVGTLHGLRMDEGHWLLWSGIGGLGLLTLGGALLQWRWTPAKVRKGVYLLHTQQVLFLATLGVLWLGHVVV